MWKRALTFVKCPWMFDTPERVIAMMGSLKDGSLRDCPVQWGFYRWAYVGNLTAILRKEIPMKTLFAAQVTFDVP